MTWDDIDKAQWILTNGPVEIIWIYESDGDIIYRRPGRNLGNCPPWVPLTRTIHTKLFEVTQHDNRI